MITVPLHFVTVTGVVCHSMVPVNSSSVLVSTFRTNGVSDLHDPFHVVGTRTSNGIVLITSCVKKKKEKRKSRKEEK